MYVDVRGQPVLIIPLTLSGYFSFPSCSLFPFQCLFCPLPLADFLSCTCLTLLHCTVVDVAWLWPVAWDLLSQVHGHSSVHGQR